MNISPHEYEAALRGEIILMTPAGVQAIEDRMAALKQEKAQAEYDLGYAAQDYPDLRENAVYGDLAIKIQLDLPRQVDDLRMMREKARVIDGVQSHSVGLGTKFRARFGEDEADYWLVGPTEAMLLGEYNEHQLVSYMSPLGQAVWGTTPGAVVRFEVGGTEREVEVLAFL